MLFNTDLRADFLKKQVEETSQDLTNQDQISDIKLCIESLSHDCYHNDVISDVLNSIVSNKESFYTNDGKHIQRTKTGYTIS